VRKTRVAVPLARSRWRHLGALFILSATLSCSVVVVEGFRQTALYTIETSVRSDQGGYAYALQIANDEFPPELAPDNSFVPVVDESVQLELEDRLVLAGLRSTPRTVPFGVLAAGRRPETDGEIAVSSRVVSDLGADLGDELVVTSNDGNREQARIVGIVAFPADTRRRLALETRPTLDVGRATTWLTNTDPYANLALQTLLDAHTANYRSTEALAAAAVAQPPREVVTLRYVPLGLGLSLATVVAAALVVFGRGVARDVDALTAAGLSRAKAWARMRDVAFSSVLVGELSGLVSGWMLLQAFSTTLSGGVGQLWLRVRFPVVGSTVLMAATVLASLVVGHSARAIRGVWGHLNVVRAPRARIPVLSSASLLLGAALMVLGFLAERQVVPLTAAGWAVPGSMIAAASMPMVLRPLAGVGSAQGSRAVLRSLAASLAPVVVSAVVVGAVTSTYSATTYRDAGLLERHSASPQPSGSFAIETVPDVLLEQLRLLYSQRGGTQLVAFEIPDESVRQLRVTSPTMRDCIERTGDEQLDASCVPENTLTPVNTVMLDSTPGATPRADPGLVEDETVGLLLYRSEDGVVDSTGSAAVESDPQLGGILPGLVIPANGEIADQFDIEPSGRSAVLLLDFYELSPREQSSLRADIGRLAPSSFTAEAALYEGYDRERRNATLVAAVGSVIVALIMGAGGASIILGHRATRRGLIDVGASLRFRARLGMRWLSPPLLGFLAGIPIVALGALIVIVGGDERASYGGSWWLPLGTGALGCLGLFLGFVSVPSSESPG
jgi:hypothetical protein